MDPARSIRFRGSSGPVAPHLAAREVVRTAAHASTIARLAGETSAQVIDSNCHWSHMEVALAARRAGVPSVLRLHDRPVPGIGTQLRGVAVRLADVAVAVSHTVADDLPGWARSRVQVSYNGVDGKVFRPGPVDPVLRALLTGGADGHVVLSVGRIERGKGIHLLIEAVAAVRRSFPDVHLAVVGSGDPQLEADLRRRAHAALGDRVHFLGHRDDVPDLLRAADVFALSSASEGLSLVVLEAQSSGLPVACFPAGAVRELVTSGETGLLARQNDVGDLAAQLKRLLADRALRVKLATNAREQVLRGFSLEAQADREAAVFDKLTSTADLPAA